MSAVPSGIGGVLRAIKISPDTLRPGPSLDDHPYGRSSGDTAAGGGVGAAGASSDVSAGGDDAAGGGGGGSADDARPCSVAVAEMSSGTAGITTGAVAASITGIAIAGRDGSVAAVAMPGAVPLDVPI